jgi:hypothetical protein
MCTVTWLRDDSGYQLFCNRDEKLTRAEALPPRVRTCNGVKFIAPIDGDRGGTWIAANEFGVTLCLLNGYPPPELVRPLVSRGDLIPKLMTAPSALSAIAGAVNLDVERYAPFVLVALEPRYPASLLVWDGSDTFSIANADSFMPLASSSFDPSGVCRHRRAEFNALRTMRGTLDAALLHEFHASHGTEASAWSACMHRSDAQTVSFTRITVSDTGVQLFYTPAAPCLRVPGLTLALARTR